MSFSSDFLSLQPSYYIDLNQGHEDHDQLFDHHHHTTPFSFSNLQQQPHLSSSVSSLSSSSSSSSPFYLNSGTDQGGYCYLGSQLQSYPYQQEVENLSLYGSGSYDQATLEINKSANNGLKFSICKKEEDKSLGVEDGGGSGSGEINGSPVKWMSSKMRLMKKMMRNEEDHKAKADNRVAKITIKSSSNGSIISNNNNNNNNENASIRVCSDCNTTKTPLWRSGPRGPKSLCNACGIRQRKARRAMAAAAIAGNNTVLPNSVTKVGNSHKKSSMINNNNNNNNNNGFGAQKKRSKMTKPSREKRKLCFEEFALSLTKKLSIQQVFPQEEKEAAILLMALSCGLVHG